MKRTIRAGLFALAAAFLLCGCAQEEPAPKEEVEFVQSTYKEKLADSLDEAIVVSVDEKESKICFYNLTLGRTYSLSYDRITSIRNRFGDELVPGQLAEGDMVRVTFLKEERLLKSLQIMEGVTVTNGLSGFEINKAAYTMSFGGEQYQLHDNVAVLSGGKELRLEEINTEDRLKVAAVDHEVMGITVERGHGYLRLTGHDAFVDGWLEVVGQPIICEIVQEQLLVVPEGDYTLYIEKDGVAGNLEVSIKRDEETLVDLSGLETEKIKKSGKIVFTITPANAKLYINGEETDYSEEVELDYGIYQMVLKAEGYSTLAQYIKVAQPLANLNIEMTKGDSDNGEETSLSANTTAKAPAASDYRVYIDAPKGIELYVNGSYVGIIPTSFPKKAGVCTISLRKDGYQTKSYQLQLDSEKKDVSYSFSDLIKRADTSTGLSNQLSGKDVSDLTDLLLNSYLYK